MQKNKELHMAIISCPNCGKSISDKAFTCPHCGCSLTPVKTQTCPECGSALPSDVTSCPNCGFPIGGSEEQPQQVEVTGVKIANKSKKKIFTVIAITVVIVAAALFFFFQKQRQQIENFRQNMAEATFLMADGATNAETCGNLIISVWSNAIWEESDPETDKYTCPDGEFVDDFNIALDNLFTDADFSQKINEISQNQTDVQALVNELHNPPTEYEAAYNSFMEFYDAYIAFTNLVIVPVGSLETFSDNFKNADTEVLYSLKALSLYFE